MYKFEHCLIHWCSKICLLKRKNFSLFFYFIWARKIFFHAVGFWFDLVSHMVDGNYKHLLHATSGWKRKILLFFGEIWRDVCFCMFWVKKGNVHWILWYLLKFFSLGKDLVEYLRSYEENFNIEIKFCVMQSDNFWVLLSWLRN